MLTPWRWTIQFQAGPKGSLLCSTLWICPPRCQRPPTGQKLSKQQGRVHLLQRKALQEGRSAIVVFEGPDAAGKGGVIRRIIPTLDARNYRVLQYGAPTDEEHGAPLSLAILAPSIAIRPTDHI